MLFLPQAVAPNIWDYKKAKEWIHKPPSFSDLNIEMWKDLNNKSYEDLNKFDAVYIMGGNTFNLLHSLRQHGFLDLLDNFIDNNRFVYGSSAGAILLGKDITPAQVGADADENKVGLSNLTGLDILGGLNIQTHYQTNQDKELFKYVADHGVNCIAIPEESGMIIEDGVVTVVGSKPVYLIKENNKTEFNVGESFKEDDLFGY